MAKSPAQVAREAVWGKASTRLRQSARLREPAIAGYRAVARSVLTGPPPKVFANSIPKSGTHLLSQLLSGAPKLWYAGMHLNHKQFRTDVDVPGDGRGEFEPDEFRRTLGKVRNGQFVTAHFARLPGAPEILADEGFVTLLMIRDPRDLVVSSAHYLASRAGLPGHTELADMNADERLLAAISGLDQTSDPTQEVPSIGERLSRYRGWLDDPATCIVRFEELVGPRGGGTQEAQWEAVRRVLAHCHRDTSDATVHALAQRTFASHSRTFRKGTIGDWRNHFTPEHEAALTASAGEHLAAFGYD